MLRVHTAGSVGGSTFVAASHLVEAGVYDRVLALSWEKQSEGNAQWGLAGGRSGGAGAGGSFAPWIRAYIQESGAPEYIGWMVAVKDRLNALKNPYAHLRLPDITLEKVRDSPMLWDPIRFLESCPSSDGAAAAVLAGDDVAETTDKPPAWVAATAVRSELSQFPGRNGIRPQAGVDCAKAVYRAAGISDPRRQIDVAELYVPFSWYEPMWLEGHGIAEMNQGWRRAVLQSDRCLGDAPLHRGRAAGSWVGRRTSSRWGTYGGSPGVRRRRPILRDGRPEKHQGMT
jgi:acetyl-CoA C-acetyltransferase